MARPPHSVSFAFPGGPLRVDSDDPEPLTELRRFYRAFPTADETPPAPDLYLESAGAGRLRLLVAGAPRGAGLPPDDLLPALERALHRHLVDRLAEPPAKWLAPEETPVVAGESKWLAPRLALHAAAVERHGRAILLPAASGRGKTTLCAALTLAGCGYLGDELTFLAATAGGRAVDPIDAVPFPKALSLKPGSSPLFAHLGLETSGAGETHLDPERLRPGCTVTAPTPVGGVLVPHYRAGAAFHLEALSAGETLLALVESAVDLPQRRRDAKLAVFARLGDLAERVRGFRLTHGDSLAAARRLLEDDRWPPP